jgi:hypothetical protein
MVLQVIRINPLVRSSGTLFYLSMSKVSHKNLCRCSSCRTSQRPGAWIVRNVWVVRIVRMVAGIVRTEAEVAKAAEALVGIWSLKLIVVELGGGVPVAPAGCSQSTAPIMQPPPTAQTHQLSTL